MRTLPHHRTRGTVGLAPFVLALLAAGSAHAQVAGVTERPLPNVMLLVDNSGSMERMFNNSLPMDNVNPENGLSNVCSPGVESNPNRWGSLVQALTGNLQPFYSCDAVSRTGNAAFRNEFKINNIAPYDDGYFLPYHRPLTGTGAMNACAFAPHELPGAGLGAGVGPGALGSGGDSRDFPDTAFQQIRNAHLRAQYAADSMIAAGNTCAFDQARDGQLDASKDYVRFALMTFDNALSNATGVQNANPIGGPINPMDPFGGMWSYLPTGSAGATGLPAGCVTPPTPFEVGARHWAAPPWEGRMIPFPAPTADIYTLQRSNEQVQKVLLGTRPFGATPIDGMLSDAQDYFWANPLGPGSATSPDPYVQGGCRDQYIILLTDGAPNLNLRPDCVGGQCPFYKDSVGIVDDLFRGVGGPSGAGGKRVTTYVIGFSVNGDGTTFANDGFPAANDTPEKRTCKWWANNLGPASLRTTCATTPPPQGSTADACCKLNEIAYAGSGGLSGGDPSLVTGAFFAESQADLVLSFGRILGRITRSASTRTVPAFSPAVSIGGVFGGQVRTAQFTASFIPNAQKVWSGEIDRIRSYCVGAMPTTQTQATSEGDSYSVNTARQAVNNQRRFISVKGDALGAAIDSARTMRPYATDGSPAYADGIPLYGGTEVTGLGKSLSSDTDWPRALDIDANTCKRSRAAVGQTTVVVPRLSNPAECADVVWGFATAHRGAQVYGSTGSPYDFNVRCTGNNADQGRCSFSQVACTVGTSACPTPGEVCIPECSALGAVFRSNPVVVGPPDAVIRDDGYRVLQQQRARRRPTMFVATADGILHAYKALASQGFDDDNYELWAFVPPAVLPKLASNYPGGQQILLDGSPVVKDVVWNRQPGADADPEQWKTTLVAGMGSGGPGYYALNVTDVDCGGLGQSCSSTYTPAGSFANASRNDAGPHFLWQLTDVPCGDLPACAADPAKKTRRATDGTQMVALFGSQSGTPAITTVQADLGDGLGVRQYGVAILPGGIDGPPQPGAPYCTRALDGGGFAAADFEAHDATIGRRSTVRRWGTTCNSPVPGRSVTVVRLDTGEIIRHFGRVGVDVPTLVQSRTTNSPFDSPIIGTPVVYPNVVGTPAQKAYFGDADGTVWRLDMTATDPSQWRVALFHDMVYSAGSGAGAAAFSQPIQIPLVLSVDPAGNPVVNAATGDQENLTASTTEQNYIASITETRPYGRAKLNWTQTLFTAERVTGPMAVFDRTLYFATYTPQIPSGSCNNAGRPRLWGVDYVNPATGGITSGGFPRFCPISGAGLDSVDPASGRCTVPAVQSQDPTTLGGAWSNLQGTIIPGVAVRPTQSCAAYGAGSDDAAITGMTATSYQLSFGTTSKRTSGAGDLGTAMTERLNLRVPVPRTTARIDAWAFVVD